MTGNQPQNLESSLSCSSSVDPQVFNVDNPVDISKLCSLFAFSWFPLISMDHAIYIILFKTVDQNLATSSDMFTEQTRALFPSLKSDTLEDIQKLFSEPRTLNPQVRYVEKSSAELAIRKFISFSLDSQYTKSSNCSLSIILIVLNTWQTLTL